MPGEPIGEGFIRSLNYPVKSNGNIRVGLRINGWKNLLKNSEFRNHVRAAVTKNGAANIIIIPGFITNNKKTTNQVLNSIYNSFNPWGHFKSGVNSVKIYGLFTGTSEFKKPIGNFETVLATKFIPKGVNKTRQLANILRNYPNIRKNIGYHLKINEYIKEFGLPTFKVTPNSKKTPGKVHM